MGTRSAALEEGGSPSSTVSWISAANEDSRHTPLNHIASQQVLRQERSAGAHASFAAACSAAFAAAPALRPSPAAAAGRARTAPRARQTQAGKVAARRPRSISPSMMQERSNYTTAHIGTNEEVPRTQYGSYKSMPSWEEMTEIALRRTSQFKIERQAAKPTKWMPTGPSDNATRSAPSRKAPCPPRGSAKANLPCGQPLPRTRASTTARSSAAVAPLGLSPITALPGPEAAAASTKWQAFPKSLSPCRTTSGCFQAEILRCSVTPTPACGSQSAAVQHRKPPATREDRVVCPPRDGALEIARRQRRSSRSKSPAPLTRPQTEEAPHAVLQRANIGRGSPSRQPTDLTFKRPNVATDGTCRHASSCEPSACSSRARSNSAERLALFGTPSLEVRHLPVAGASRFSPDPAEWPRYASSS